MTRNASRRNSLEVGGLLGKRDGFLKRKAGIIVLICIPCLSRCFQGGCQGIGEPLLMRFKQLSRVLDSFRNLLLCEGYANQGQEGRPAKWVLY